MPKAGPQKMSMMLMSRRRMLSSHSISTHASSTAAVTHRFCARPGASSPIAPSASDQLFRPRQSYNASDPQRATLEPAMTDTERARASALDRMLARDAIREILARYARAIDRADGALLKSCYFDDAIEEHGSSFTGRAHDY